MTRRLFLATPAAALAAGPATMKPDRFLGDFEGERTVGVRKTPLCAQVFPLGGGRYQINFLPEFDQRCPPLGALEGKVDGSRIRFAGGGWSGSVTADRIAGESPTRDKPVPFELRKKVRLSPHLNAKAPGGAVALFDGTSLSEWEGYNGRGETGQAGWKAIDGVLHPTPVERKPEVMRHIVSKQAFQDYRLHVEFRSPLMAESRGQLRGNSGIVFEDYAYHELQILDSYGSPGYYDDCGSIYKVVAPLINMCAPPLQWQSYDVTYRAARYGAGGKLLELARITVDHNGKLIHKEFELPDTPAAEKMRRTAPGERRQGRIRLTYHNDPVEYRNIWLVKV